MKYLTTSTTNMTIGIDLGDRYSRFCVLDESGEIVLSAFGDKAELFTSGEIEVGTPIFVSNLIVREYQGRPSSSIGENQGVSIIEIGEHKLPPMAYLLMDDIMPNGKTTIPFDKSAFQSIVIFTADRHLTRLKNASKTHISA